MQRIANKNLKIVFRIGISSLFIGFLSVRVDWGIIYNSFSEINLNLYAVSTLITFFSILFVACKYYLLIKDTSISHGIASLIKINLISRFYSLFLPSAIGTEAVRWYKVTRNQRGRALFLASTIFERSFFILVLLLFGSIPLFFYSSIPEIVILRIRIFPVVIFSLIIIFFCITYFIVPEFRSFFNSMLNKTLTKRLKNIDIALFLKNLNLNEPRPKLYANIFILSIIWQLFFLLRLFILMKAASIPLNFIDVAWIGSLVLLLQIIPISFAGIGIREGAYAYLFTMFNLPQEKGVLIGILFFSQMLILAGLGAVFTLFEK